MAKRRGDLPAMSLRVTPAGFVPATTFDQEMHARLKVGSVVEADIHHHKSPDLLKLYWGFLSFVVASTGRHGSARSLSNSLLVAGGYVESFTALHGGGTHAHPASIAEMDAQEFKTYTEAAFATIWEEFGIDVETYKQHLRTRGF